LPVTNRYHSNQFCFALHLKTGIYLPAIIMQDEHGTNTAKEDESKISEAN